MNLGMDITVVHLMEDLMERQLDRNASSMLQAELERQGVKFAMGKQTVELLGEQRFVGYASVMTVSLRRTSWSWRLESNRT